MKTRWWSLVSGLPLVAGGCGSDGSGPADSGQSSTPPGALACTGPAVDCRMAFSDTYDVTYEGGASGRFTLYVDIIGGIQGSGPGVATITGQVDEFGRIQFSFPDGTAFTGQFKADHLSFQGTWKSSNGKSGTFSGQSATKSASGTGGTGSAGGSGGSPTATVTASAVLAASEQACQHAASCGLVAASDCPIPAGVQEPPEPPQCWDEVLAFYQCISNGSCNYDVECATPEQSASACVLGSSTGSYPPNPDYESGQSSTVF